MARMPASMHRNFTSAPLLPSIRSASASALTSSASGIFLVTSEGTMIRTELSAVRICGRSSQGVIIMRTQPGERVISLAAAPKEDEETFAETGEETVETMTAKMDTESDDFDETEENATSFDNNDDDSQE